MEFFGTLTPRFWFLKKFYILLLGNVLLPREKLITTGTILNLYGAFSLIYDKFMVNYGSKTHSSFGAL